MNPSHCRWCVYAALFLGTIWTLIGLEALFNPYLYPFPPDSASYIEMARQLMAHHAPWVTPWDPSPEADAIPQLLFPPGFAVLIALFGIFTSDAAQASLWVVHVFAALIPVTLVWMFDGLLSRRALLMLGVLTLFGAGMVQMQHFAYSDVPTVFFEMVAIGAIVKALQANPQSPVPSAWWWVAGVAIGLAYDCRNAAVAVVLAVGAWFVCQWWQSRSQRGAWWQAALRVGCGFLIPASVLWVYNWVEFHALQPYVMPPSERSAYLNLLDLGHAISRDVGIPPTLLPAPWCLVVLVVWWILAVQGYWRLRNEAIGGVVLLGLLLVGAHESVLWWSRTKYEWGGAIEVRHTLSFTWAEYWVLALVLYRQAPELRRRQLGTAAVLSLIGLMSAAASTVDDWHHWGPEPWVRLSTDLSWVEQVPKEPPETMVVSNIAPFFRVQLGLPVREWELGGNEQDAIHSFQKLNQLVAGRPTVLWLACTTYTGEYAICGDHPEDSQLKCQWIRRAYPKLLRCETTVGKQRITPTEK